MVPGSLLGSSLLQAGYGLRELSIPMSRDVNRPGFGGDPAGAHDEFIVPRRDRGVQGKFHAFLSDVAHAGRRPVSRTAVKDQSSGILEPYDWKVLVALRVITVAGRIGWPVQLGTR